MTKRRAPKPNRLARQEHPLTELRFEQLFHKLPTACFCCDTSGAIVEWNRGSETLFGYSCSQVLLRPIWKVIGRSEDAEGEDARIVRTLFQSILAGQAYEGVELMDRAADGTLRCLLCYAFPLYNSTGTIIGAVCTCLDISERLRMEQERLEANRRLEEANEQLEALATLDGLTGLKNHRAFQERLTLEVGRAHRYHQPLSLVLLDVDHFKQYNDTYGHPAGDAVLREVARQIGSSVRGEDLAARYGGEEFVLLLSHCTNADAVIVAERCRAALAAVAWPERPVTASFGIATLAPGMAGTAELIAAADRALYAAKRAGRNQFAVA